MGASSAGAPALVFRLIAVLLLVVAPLACPASEPQTVTLAVPDHDPLIEAGLGLVGDLYRRIGWQIRETHLQARHSAKEFDLGDADGELLRVAEPDQRFSDAITIPGSLLEGDIAAFTDGRPAILPRGWLDLRGHSVCTRPGLALIDEKLSGMRVIHAGGSAQAFRLLKTGRCEFAVLPRTAWIEAQEAGIAGLTEVSPALDHFTTYHVVSRKRAMLVPYLAAVLRQMRAEGAIARAQADLSNAITAARDEMSAPR